MSSLDRLIKLARKTGDRLIVHDPLEGNDIVLMGVEQYEALLEDDNDLHIMNERQLLNKINRDIAIWRANREMDSGFSNDWNCEEGVEEEEFRPENIWHSAGSVLSDRDFGGHDEQTTVNNEGNTSVYEDFYTETMNDNEETENLNNVELGNVDVPEVSLLPVEESVKETQQKPDGEPVFYEEPV